MTPVKLMVCYFTCVVLAGCSASTPPYVRPLSNGTYLLSFPKDSISGQYWKEINRTVPPYMRENRLIPAKCQHGVIIIHQASTHAQSEVIFKCAP